jgi:gentisate 1,2-dioxygenase
MSATPASMSRSHDSMEAFREDLANMNLAPLWDAMRKLAPRGPSGSGEPVHWEWKLLRSSALRAGELITAEEAERRVLVLQNPAFPGEGKATTSLYAGIQLLLPGETAPSHRHTASALRLIMEGRGAYTAVDGERVMMSPGDFIITPSATFHDHGNDGNEPVLWLDGLDVFTVNLLNAAFGEDHPEKRQPVLRLEGASSARFSSGLLPADFPRDAQRSSVFSWPYERSRDALLASVQMERIDPALGAGLRFVDPATGQSPIRTMSAGMRMFPAGFVGDRFRSISGSVMAVVDGHGHVMVDQQKFDLAPNDVFIVPSWRWHSFEAHEDLVVFAFSDEELQRHLGFWREERAAKLD